MENTLFPKLREQYPDVNLTDEQVIDHYVAKSGKSRDAVALGLFRAFGNQDDKETYNKLQSNYESTKRSQAESSTKKIVGSTIVPLASGSAWLVGSLSRALDYAIPDDIANNVFLPNPLLNGFSSLNELAKNTANYLERAEKTTQQFESEAVKRSLTGEQPRESNGWDIAQKVTGEVFRMIPFMALSAIGTAGITASAIKAGMSVGKAALMSGVASSAYNATINAVSDYNTTYDYLKQQHPDWSDEQLNKEASIAGRESLGANFAQGIILETLQAKQLGKLVGIIPTKSTMKQLGKEITESAIKKIARKTGTALGESLLEGGQEMAEQFITNAVSGQPHDWHDYKEAGALGVIASIPFSVVGLSLDLKHDLSPQGKIQQIAEFEKENQIRKTENFKNEVNKVITKKADLEEATTAGVALAEGTDPEYIKKRDALAKQIQAFTQQLEYHRNALNEAEPNSPQYTDAVNRFQTANTELTNIQQQLLELEQNKPEVKSEQVTAQGNQLPDLQENQNAIQEQGTGEILQQPQEGTGETGSERGRVESSEQRQEATPTQQEDISRETPREEVGLSPTAVDYINRSLEARNAGNVVAGQDVKSLYDELSDTDKMHIDNWLESKGKSINSFRGKDLTDAETAELHTMLSAIHGSYQDIVAEKVKKQADKAEEVRNEIIGIPTEEQMRQNEVESSKKAQPEKSKEIKTVSIIPADQAESSGLLTKPIGDGSQVIAYSPNVVTDSFNEKLNDLQQWASGIPVRNKDMTLSRRSLKRALSLIPNGSEIYNKVMSTWNETEELDKFQYPEVTEEDRQSAEIGVKQSKTDEGQLREIAPDDDTEDQRSYSISKSAREVGAQSVGAGKPKDIEPPMSAPQKRLYDTISKLREANAQEQKMSGVTAVKPDFKYENGKFTPDLAIFSAIQKYEGLKEADNLFRVNEESFSEVEKAEMVDAKAIDDMYSELNSLRTDIQDALEVVTYGDLIENIKAEESGIPEGKTEEEYMDEAEERLKQSVAEYNEKLKHFPEKYREFPPLMLTNDMKETFKEIFGDDIANNKTGDMLIENVQKQIAKDTGGQGKLNVSFFGGLEDKNFWKQSGQDVEKVTKWASKFYQEQMEEAKKATPEKAEELMRSGKLLAMQVVLPHTLMRMDSEGTFKRVYWKVGDIFDKSAENLNTGYEILKNKVFNKPVDVQERAWKFAKDGTLWKQDKKTKMVYVDQNGKELSNEYVQTITNQAIKRGEEPPKFEKIKKVTQEYELGKVWTDEELVRRYGATPDEIEAYRGIRESADHFINLMLEKAHMAGLSEADIADMKANLVGYMRMTRGTGEYALKYPDDSTEFGYGYMRFDSARERRHFREKLQKEKGYSYEQFEDINKFSDYAKRNTGKLSPETLYDLLSNRGVNWNETEDTKQLIEALVKEIHSRSKEGQSRIQRKGIPTEISWKDYEKIYRDWAYNVSRSHAIMMFKPDIDEEIRLANGNSVWKSYSDQYVNALFDNTETNNVISRVIQRGTSMAYMTNLGLDMANAVSDIFTTNALIRAKLSEKQFGLAPSDIGAPLRAAAWAATKITFGQSMRKALVDEISANSFLKDFPELPSIYDKATLSDRTSRGLHEERGDEEWFKKYVENPMTAVVGRANQHNKITTLLGSYMAVKKSILGDKVIGNKALADIVMEMADLSPEALLDIRRETGVAGEVETEYAVGSEKAMQFGKTGQKVSQQYVERKRMLDELRDKLVSGNLSEDEKQRIALRMAMQMQQEANMVYGKRNTPLYALGAGNMRSLLRAGYQFRVFTRGLNGFFLTSFMNGRISKGQMLYLLAPMFFAGGLRNIVPYWDDIDDLLYYAGITNLDEDMRNLLDNQSLYEAVQHGIVSSLPGQAAFDLSQKMGKGQVFPRGSMKLAGSLLKGFQSDRQINPDDIKSATGEILTSMLLGAQYGKALDVYKSFSDLWDGADYTTWVKVLNRQAGALLDTYNSLNRGIVRNGELLVDKDKLGLGTTLSQAVGFKTQYEKNEILKRKALKYAQDEYNDIRDVFGNRLLDALDEAQYSGDDSKLQRILADIAIHNDKVLSKGEYELVYVPDDESIQDAIARRNIEGYRFNSANERMMPKAQELQEKYKR